MSNGCHTHGQKIWKPDRKSSLGHYPASEQRMFTLANQCAIEDKCFNSIECKNEFKELLSQFPCHSTFGQITDDFRDLETHSMFVLLMYINQED